MMIKRLMIIWLLILLVGCGGDKEPQAFNEEENMNTINVNAEGDLLIVPLINGEGKSIGDAQISENEDGVKISIDVKGLQPGLHGFHIHEKGICNKPTFDQSGSHFNPDDKAHGFHHVDGPHAGDLPNLNISEDGTIRSVYMNNHVTLKHHDTHSLRGENGSALLIHEKEDDYITQPAGNSGARIACGVISEPMNKSK